MAARSGDNKGTLTVLIVLVIGVGGWNFYQNTQLDNAAPRPYRSNSDAEIGQLISQYEAEMGRQTQRYREVSKHKVQIQNRGLLGDQLDEFERVQKISQQRRGVARQVTDNQIALDHLESELQKREADRPVYKMFFRRLVTFNSI